MYFQLGIFTLGKRNTGFLVLIATLEVGLVISRSLEGSPHLRHIPRALSFGGRLAGHVSSAPPHLPHMDASGTSH
jgi:hypothetical protein